MRIDGDFDVLAEVTDLQCVAVAERDGLQSGGLPDLQQRNVGRRIAADDAAGEFAAILGPDLHRGRIGDDMVGRQHIPALRIDDHPRAGGVDLFLELLGDMQNSRNSGSW